MVISENSSLFFFFSLVPLSLFSIFSLVFVSIQPVRVFWLEHLIQFSSVQLLSCVRFFVTPWTEARQASLSLIIFWSSPCFMSIESVMLPTIGDALPPSSSSACSLSQHQSLFPMSWLFASGGQSIGASASASVLPHFECGLRSSSLP